MIFKFEDNLWIINNNGVEYKLLNEKMNLEGEWAPGNIASTLYCDDIPVSFFMASQHTPIVIYSEEMLGLIQTLQMYLKTHADYIFLGATCDSDTVKDEVIELVKHICGYYGIAENTYYPIPFKDGSWVKAQGFNYFCHLQRMYRSGRYYTARTIQTSYPGNNFAGHEIDGVIDPTKTFYLASNLDDEDKGVPVINTKDGKWPRPFSLAN